MPKPLPRSVVIKIAVPVCLAALFMGMPVITSTWAATLPPQDKPASKLSPALRERAKKLYAQDCAMCHGDNGDGKSDIAASMKITLLDYTDPKSLAGKSDQELFDIIRKGKGDHMPPEEVGRAKDDEVWALVAYIRGFARGGASSDTGE